MAITYPLSLPTTIGIANITFSAENAMAISESPFSYAQQVLYHPGQRWRASVSLPPIKREDAEDWLAFILSMKINPGANTPSFLLGDPNGVTPRGSASTTPGTPRVNGGSQTGNTLIIDGLPVSVTGYLKAGDYIQLGSGSTSTLYKVLTQVNSNNLGQATLDIWPALRSSPADNALLIVSSCKGRFRLSNPIQQWEINNISSYGISFDCVEVL